ncbi:OadG family protein [endosymbiont of Lamellibrachia barhami]|uniref:OadG family protein n=1 Tax=endosymbiont of Lamellibrachia barhami TaxID=205975 RepID=UPI0015A988EF|nr:OadG family protein [endosymbiont of Lamellibrachia barhami]
MPISDLMLAGSKLMALGMGIVFSFLVVLVFIMLAMSRFAMALQKPELEEQPDGGLPVSQQDHQAARGDLVAVITAAVTRYRATHN